MNKLLVILVGLMMLSCSDDEIVNTMEQDFMELNATFESIQALANSVPCTDATLWSFTAYGDKACGGPQGFIAYPLTIDVAVFLNRIEGHRLRENFLNQKWGITSTCDIPAPPQTIACENGIAVLVY